MCSSHLVAENLQMAAHFIEEAAKEGAQLIVLPENFAIMGLKDADKIKVKEIFGKGEIQTFLSQQAERHHVWLVGGTIPIASANEKKVRASSLVFNALGQTVARYDKIHLFDVTISATEAYKESDTVESGDEIVVVPTPFGELGLAVCYDLRFPELFRSLFNKGAEIFILPSAFTVKTGEAHWEPLTRSRAIENFCYLIGAAQGGIHSSGRKTYGNSLLIEPWGQIVAQKVGIESGVIYTEIDLKKLYEIRKSIPTDQHQRIFCEWAKNPEQFH